MKLTEALKELKKGGRIRCENWHHKREYIVKDDGRMYHISEAYNFKKEWKPTFGELESINWNHYVPYGVELETSIVRTSDAFELLNGGRQLSRACWDKNRYVEKGDKDQIYETFRDSFFPKRLWSPVSTDLVAHDWQLIWEKHKLSD